LMGKLFMTCNPKKNFLYDDFYLPNKEGHIADSKKFIQTYPWENPFLTEDYLRNLKKLKEDDPVAYERLYLGNWEYTDDQSGLFDYEDCLNLFRHKSYISKERNRRFMTVDPSGKGKDRTVIMIFAGLHYVEKIYSFKKISAPDLEKTIKEVCRAYQIPHNRVIYDDDGLGYYLGDYIPGSRAFKGGHRPLGRNAKKEYPNLRTQLYYRLSKDIKSGLLHVNEDRKPYRDMITRELSAIKADKIDEDGKRYLMKKKTVISNLGNSPDFGDCLMMSRMGPTLFQNGGGATA